MSRRLLLSLLPSALAFGCTPTPDEPRGPASTHGTLLPPLGVIDSDALPLKMPEAWERTEDSNARPYHLLVRVLLWPELEPVDVDLSILELQVPGADAPPFHVGDGEYLFSPLSQGVTRVILRDKSEGLDWSKVAAGEVVPSFSQSMRIRAERNPVALARFSITTCDLVWIKDQELDSAASAIGAVFDLSTGKPVEGATVTYASFSVRTNAQGRFQFEKPPLLRDLLRAAVACEGFQPQRISPRTLTGTWARYVRDQGEVVFTLRPVAPPRGPRPSLSAESMVPR